VTLGPKPERPPRAPRQTICFRFLSGTLAAGLLLAGCETVSSLNVPTLADLNPFERGPNRYLWRASLDTLAFVPVVTDEDRGLVASDWYTPPEAPGERLKLRVYVLGPKMEAANLRVQVLRQVRDSQGNWVETLANPGTAEQMERIIFARAETLERGR
jgi:hypothetical protein